MKLEVNNTNVNYIDYGNKNGDAIVFLHGWGQNIQMMKPVADEFERTNRIIIIDFPGFGESDEPSYAWTNIDYVNMLSEFFKKIDVTNPILVGHSFGGRISLLYASMHDVKKLVLFGSPFKKEIKKDSLKTKTLKALKKVPGINKLEGFAKKHIGSNDYRKASELMRQVMVNSINHDMTDDVKKIKCPTLIIWGTLDEAVPLERAYELEKLISDSAVIEYEGCSHYAYLERLGQTVNILDSFIGGKDE